MHRLLWLLMLEQGSEIGLVEFPYFHDGKPDDAVFKALAKIKIAGAQRRRESDVVVCRREAEAPRTIKSEE
jgi:hypothetical protein